MATQARRRGIERGGRKDHARRKNLSRSFIDDPPDAALVMNDDSFAPNDLVPATDHQVIRT